MKEKVIVKSKPSIVALGIFNAVLVVLCWFIATVIAASNESTPYFTWLAALFVPAAAVIAALNWIHRCSLVVTDTRVYGKATFGKSVDIPLEDITAVGKTLFKGVRVKTSRPFDFSFIQNNDKICRTINALLSELKEDLAKEQFYLECVKNGIEDFSSQKNRQRGQLLAEKYKLPKDKTLEELYKEGLERNNKTNEKLKQDQLAELRQNEQQEFEQFNRYANLKGKDKRIAMLSDAAAALRAKAESQKRAAGYLMGAGVQKESSWATLGGAASGIAGPAAGVATAMDVQRKNAEIRQSNQAYLNGALPGIMGLSSRAEENIDRANRIDREIENFKLKLMSNDSAYDLMKSITFDGTKISVSETGAVTVSTKATLAPDFKIFGDVPAVVDGTIYAGIYDDGRCCATVNLVLPLYGIGQNVRLKGMSLDGGEPGKEYSVKFSATNLCALEK